MEENDPRICGDSSRLTHQKFRSGEWEGYAFNPRKWRESGRQRPKFWKELQGRVTGVHAAAVRLGILGATQNMRTTDCRFGWRQPKTACSELYPLQPGPEPANRWFFPQARCYQLKMAPATISLPGFRIGFFMSLNLHTLLHTLNSKQSYL